MKKTQTKADLLLENAYLRAALTLIGLDKLTGIPVPPAVSAFACLVVIEPLEEKASNREEEPMNFRDAALFADVT